ncbi:MAG: MFS transporter [Campylobacterota bacterium]|nr:MFS transporter [Campylobacterota bacterium]
MAPLLALFYFFYFAIIAVHIIFMPKILSEVGYAPSEIGIIFAAAPLIRFIIPFAFIKGVQFNRKIFNYALALLSFSAIAFYPSLEHFYALLFANIGLGIGLSLILPFVEVIALTLIGKERYGKVRLYGSVGFILVSLVLVEFLSSPQTAVYYLIAMSLATALFGYIIAKHDPSKSSSSDESNLDDFNILQHWKLWGGLLLMQVSFGAFYNFFTIYETERGISLDMTIYLWSFGVIVEIVMLYFQGPLLKRNLLHVLQFTTAFTAFRWFILFMFPTDLTLLFASQAIHALSFALFHSAAISYLFTLYPQKKLAQQFFFGISYGLGGFVGAIGAGYIYELWPSQLFLVAAVIAFFSYALLKGASQEINSQ